MNYADPEIPGRVKSWLEETNLNDCIVYFCPELIHPGNYALGDITLSIPWKAYIIFVDLCPLLNWGHDCYYLAFQDQGKETTRVEARFPSGLYPGQLKFRLLYKGADAPDWAVMSDPV